MFYISVEEKEEEERRLAAEKEEEGDKEWLWFVGTMECLGIGDLKRINGLFGL